MRALQSSGRRWRVALSIRASRSGSRRSVSPAIAIASAWSGGDRSRASDRGVVQRLTLAKDGIEHSQSGLARAQTLNAWHRCPHHHLGAMKRPKHLTPRPTSVRLRRCRNLNLSTADHPPVRKRGSTQRAMATGKRRESRSIFSLPSSPGGRLSSVLQQLVDRPRPPTIHPPLRRSACRCRVSRAIRWSTGAVKAPSATVRRSIISSRT